MAGMWIVARQLTCAPRPRHELDAQLTCLTPLSTGLMLAPGSGFRISFLGGFQRGRAVSKSSEPANARSLCSHFFSFRNHPKK